MLKTLIQITAHDFQNSLRPNKPTPRPTPAAAAKAPGLGPYCTTTVGCYCTTTVG